MRMTEAQFAALKGGKRIPARRRGEAACDLFAAQLEREGIAFTREHKFLARRRFRFDFALHIPRIAVEIDGGVHVVRKQWRADREKGNLATAAGWRVLHFRPDQVRSGEALDLLTLVL